MTPRKADSKTDSEYELYLQRFNSMGLELPEAAAANPASMQLVASFLLKHEVFGELDGLADHSQNESSQRRADGQNTKD